MKLLGWMHRKLRQNGSEPFKDFSIGQQLVDEQQHYSRPNYATGLKQAYRDHFRKSFTGLEVTRVEEEYVEEDYGFLAIGTLGSDPLINDPSTPTFSISIDNITEKSTEVTENELKLINDELENVFGAEAKENGFSDSSRRNSYVSTGRSSHGSAIALGSKLVEGQETNGYGTTVFPLQGYLLGSAIEQSETTTVAKKEHRASLGELFQMSKIAEENSGTKYEREEKRREKEAEKSTVHLMKKMLKKKMLHASSRTSSAAAGGTVDTASAETKLRKILHMFHRKVHPDNPKKDENKKNVYPNGGNSNGGQMRPGEGIMIFPRKSLSERTIRCYKSQSNPPHFSLGGGDLNGNTAYWIKTDANYLVLEL